MITGIILDFGAVCSTAHGSTAGCERAAVRLGYTLNTLYALLYSAPDWNAAKLGHVDGTEWTRRPTVAIGTETDYVVATDAFGSALLLSTGAGRLERKHRVREVLV